MVGALEILGGAFAGFTLLISIMRVCRRRAERLKPPAPGPVFDLAELRCMLAAGSISPQEFEALKTALGRRTSTPYMAGARGFDVLPPKSGDPTSG